MGNQKLPGTGEKGESVMKPTSPNVANTETNLEIVHGHLQYGFASNI